ncbi:MAG: adenylate/guanylate cyclase domain-containing protein, partial [Bacteroidota bacterium]
KQIADLQATIAKLYELQGSAGSAVAYFQMSANTYRKLDDTVAERASQQALARLLQEVVDVQATPLVDTLSTDLELKASITRFEQLANQAREKQDLAQYIKYYQKYQDLRLSFIERQKQRELDSIKLVGQSTELILLTQENELNEMEILQKEATMQRQAQFRNGLIAGVVLLLLLAVVFWWLFSSKRKAHRDLSKTYARLDETRKQLVAAELNVKKLLGQQVSQDIAEALMVDEIKERLEQKYVCIMFLDIRDFTLFASSHTPAEVLAYQNNVFGFMIEIISNHHGVINQFMGDGFMATFGAPVSYENDVLNAYRAACEIVSEVNLRSKSSMISDTRIGIGLHAGEVVAGNVGTDVRKQYSITGTTVITAARIEQLNKKYKSQLLISEAVANEINEELPENAESIQAHLKGIEEPVGIYKIY